MTSSKEDWLNKVNEEFNTAVETGDNEPEPESMIRRDVWKHVAEYTVFLMTVNPIEGFKAALDPFYALSLVVDHYMEAKGDPNRCKECATVDDCPVLKVWELLEEDSRKTFTAAWKSAKMSRKSESN